MAKAGNQGKKGIASNKIHTCHDCGVTGKEDTHRCIIMVSPTGRQRVVRKCTGCYDK